MYHKQLKLLVNQIVASDIIESVEDNLLEDYKKLNDKCDHIISKIKNRKSQQENR